MPSEADLNAILKAGVYAPSGMGRQPVKIIAITNKELRDKISAENAKIMGVDIDPFYGAPVILIVLADKNVTVKYRETYNVHTYVMNIFLYTLLESYMVDVLIKDAILSEEDIPTELRKTLGNTTTKRYDRFIHDIITNSEGKDDILMSDEIHEAMMEIRH